MATLVLNRDSLSVKLESDHLVRRDNAAPPLISWSLSALRAPT